MGFNVPGSRFHSSYCNTSSSFVSGSITQNYQILKNNIPFTTTSIEYQKSHEYNINIPETFLYNISFFCIWNSKFQREKNIDIKILLNNSIELPYNKINEIIIGSYNITLNAGNNNISFHIKTNILTKEVNLISSKIELFKIYN